MNSVPSSETTQVFPRLRIFLMLIALREKSKVNRPHPEFKVRGDIKRARGSPRTEKVRVEGLGPTSPSALLRLSRLEADAALLPRLLRALPRHLLTSYFNRFSQLSLSRMRGRGM